MSADIELLQVMHWPKLNGKNAMTDLPSEGFIVDTCLRRLDVGMAMPGARLTMANPMRRKDRRAKVEFKTGANAYGFLLEIATGLRSAIPGETNIFGQFKKAWLKFQHANKAVPLAPVMHQLFADTKMIRRNYLEGIGGSSYGSLVRKLIAAKSGERILFVGAGALARSMLPMFDSHSIGIWTRHELKELPPDVGRVFTQNQGQRAANWADHVILCTPPDTGNDDNWRAWTLAAGSKTVVHLGHGNAEFASAERQKWENNSRYCDLLDVFALRAGQDNLREYQLRRATIACWQRTLAIKALARPGLENHTLPNTFIPGSTTHDPILAPA